MIIELVWCECKPPPSYYFYYLFSWSYFLDNGVIFSVFCTAWTTSKTLNDIKKSFCSVRFGAETIAESQRLAIRSAFPRGFAIGSPAFPFASSLCVSLPLFAEIHRKAKSNGEESPLKPTSVDARSNSPEIGYARDRIRSRRCHGVPRLHLTQCRVDSLPQPLDCTKRKLLLWTTDGRIPIA